MNAGGRLQQLHPELPGRLEAFLAERGESWRQLERGELDYTLEELSWFLVNADPVLWAECNLTERPENGGGMWRLFDFQRASLRLLDVDVVNASAAGVGKTREIVVLILWGLIQRPGSILMIGNADGTLDEVWTEIAWQRSRNPWLDQQIPRDDDRLKPYRSLRARNGNRLITRPTGHDGEPLRGVHVHQFILGDEAAKWANPKIYDEMWRAAEHGCRVRLYSVPDGRRDTEFFRLKEAAPPVDAYLADGATATLAGRTWVRVTWTKPEMPPPHWSEERRQELIRRYGGEDTNGYRQNVLGLDGEPAAAVFPWGQLSRCLGEIPEYRVIELVRDDAQGEVRLRRLRPNPLHGVDHGGELPASSGAQPLVVEREEHYEPANFDVAACLSSVLRPLPEGHYVAGVDFGGSTDPTEILVFELRGARRRLVLRVQLRRWDYPAQRAAIGVLDAELVRPSYGWGLDATGVGTAAEQEVRREVAEVSGYVWNANRPAVHPETGEDWSEEDAPRQVSAKELATQVLEYLVQRAHLELPFDPDVVAEWSSHTSTQSATGRRLFGKTNDHTIDAARAAVLRAFDVEHGEALPELDFAVPKGARRPSVDLLESW